MAAVKSKGCIRIHPRPVERGYGGIALTASIGWILIVSGLVTAGGGLAALFLPKLFLRLGLGDESPTNSALFFVRHWGVLIVAVGVLIVYSAYFPAIRLPVLVGRCC